MQNIAPATPTAKTTGTAVAPATAGAAVTLAHLVLIGLALLGWFLVIDLRTDLATGWVDSAIYHALFLDVWAIQDRFGDVYWLSRWPWILTGKAMFLLFEPAVASFALTFFASWFYGAGLYALLRQMVTPLAALAGAVLGCCGLYVTQTASAGYPSVMSVAFLMLGAALVVRGNRRNALWLIVLGGFAYGLAAMAHSFAALVGFCLHVSLLAMRLREQPLGRMVRNEITVLLAAALMLPVSIAVFYWMGSSEEVFRTLNATSQQAFQGQGAAFRKGPRLMLQDAGAYVLLVGGFIAVLVSWGLAGLRWSAIPPGHRLAHVAFLVMLGGGLAFDFGANGVTLQYGFYQIFQIGGAVVQLAVLLDRVAATHRSRLAGMAAALVLTVVGVLIVLFVLDMGYATATVFGVVVAAAALGCLVMLVLSLVPRLRPFALFLVPVFVALIASGGSFSRYSLMAHGQGVEGAPGIETVAWAMDMAKAHAGPEAPLFVAYDRGTIAFDQTYPISNDRWYFTFRNQSYFFTIFDTIAGASLWGRGLVATTMDDFTVAELDIVLANQGKAAVMVMWQGGDEILDENVWAEISDPNLVRALGSNPNFRRTSPLEVRSRLIDHGLLVGLRTNGQFVRPGAVPFYYVVFDVVLPDPSGS